MLTVYFAEQTVVYAEALSFWWSSNIPSTQLLGVELQMLGWSLPQLLYLRTAASMEQITVSAY